MMKRIILPLILSICFISESLFVQFVPRDPFGSRMIIVPHFLLVVLLLMGIYYVRNRAIVFAFIFGLIFDVFHTGILGVYLFLFPLSIYIASKMMKILQTNIFIAGLVTILNVAIVEFLVYELNILIEHISMSMMTFLNIRLLPTLVVNLIFFVIFSYPLKKLMERRKKQVIAE